ncbi:MAG: lysoplasmalogenase [Anaerolineaceae bacterium]|nr:lysoplasmalogenase [Anaerolineaceae bacterium]
MAKPATLLALIGWLWQASQGQPHENAVLVIFGLALLFSLAGDVLLLFPRRFFMAGLGAFLTAHIFYIFAFNQSPPPFQAGSLLLLAGVAGLFYLIRRRVMHGLQQRSGPALLRIAVSIYSMVLSLMLLSALLTLLRPDWLPAAAGLVSLGAVLFFCSDSLLALDRFDHPLPYGQLFVHITYHLGQIALVGGALLRYAR